MLQVKTFLDKSTIHGIGLFADQNIFKGTIVWRFDGRFDRIIPIEETTLYKDFFEFYAERQGNFRLLCGDNARFMNHSVSPNCSDPDFFTCIANRDIQKGEELTCDYRQICDDAARENNIFVSQRKNGGSL